MSFNDAGLLYKKGRTILKFARVLDVLFSGGKKPAIDVEAEMLWLEVQSIFISTINELEPRSVKLKIYQDWDHFEICYRLGTDSENVRRRFRSNYSPNQLTTLESRAKSEGLYTKYTPSNKQYPHGLLEIKYPIK